MRIVPNAQVHRAAKEMSVDEFLDQLKRAQDGFNKEGMGSAGMKDLDYTNFLWCAAFLSYPHPRCDGSVASSEQRLRAPPAAPPSGPSLRYVGVRSAHVSTCQHTSAHVITRQHLPRFSLHWSTERRLAPQRSFRHSSASIAIKQRSNDENPRRRARESTESGCGSAASERAP